MSVLSVNKKKIFQDKVLCQAIYWTKLCTFMIKAFKLGVTLFKKQKVLLQNLSFGENIIVW